MTQQEVKGTVDYRITDYRGTSHVVSFPTPTLADPIETARAAQVAELYGMLSMEALLEAQEASLRESAKSDAMMQALSAQAEETKANTRTVTLAAITSCLAVAVAALSTVMVVRTHRRTQETKDTLDRLIWLQAKETQDRTSRTARAEALLASAEATVAAKK